MAIKHMKTYSTSLTTRETQSKTTMRYYFILMRMDTIKKKKESVGEEVEKEDPCTLSLGM